MQKKMVLILGLAVLALMAAGCSDQNPTNSPTGDPRLRPASPLAAPAIGDLVWLDVNKDGLQGDPVQEPGLAAVTVELFNCGDTMVAQTTTDTMGFFGFQDLTPGNYYLHFVLPEGYRFSPKGMGGNDSLDSDADTLTGKTDCVAIDSAETDLTLDAGMSLVVVPVGGTIGDRVWLDDDLDGIQDDMMDEDGLAGVQVSIFACGDTLPMAQTVTDTMGFYQFVDLLPGEYALHFEPPVGYMFSPMDQGENDSLDSDVDPLTGMTVCIFLDSAEVDDTWDAGMRPIDLGCTRSKGYWKNHAGFGPQADVVTELLPIWLGWDDGAKAMAVTDAQIAVDILSQDVYGVPSNGITKLYAQLLAAKLNIADGAFDGEIDAVITGADEFLAGYDWMDWDSLTKDQMKMVLGWKDVLDDYNNGIIGPGYCADDDDDNVEGDGQNLTSMQ